MHTEAGGRKLDRDREAKGGETMRTRERDRHAGFFDLCVRVSKRVNRPGLPPLL